MPQIRERTLRFVWLFVLVACNAFANDKTATPLVHAHAHNDYEHKRPLLDALELGFCSVEADIHLVDGQLLVAHDRKNAKPERKLETLYLEPLRERIAKNSGRVYGGEPTVFLFIDIKSEPESTYAILRPLLEKYSGILTRFEAEKISTNAVTVIITGNQPRTTMARESIRYAACDGRIADLASDFSPALMPVISDNWKKFFNWNGRGEFPEAEKQKLQKFVAEIHRQGRRVRFWQAPDEVGFWRELRKAKVDIISADDLSALHKFLREEK